MNDKFANRLKALRKLKGYTQKDFSDIIGVKQTTVSNYEKGLRFPDLDKLNQIANIFNVSVDYLIGRNEFDNEIIDTNKYKIVNKEEYKRVLEYLLNGNKDKARNLIINIYNSGVEIEFIYFNILEKVLKEIGRLWEIGKIDVWNEHYVSENILDIMREIKSIQDKKKYNNISLISLTAGAEEHNIGIKMISDLLEVEGYNVTYLGSNIPTNSIINAIRSKKPRAIAISVTISHNIEAAKNIIKAIRDVFNGNSPIIIIGGMAFNNINDVFNEIGADYYCKDIEDIKRVCNI